jgi:hypothetical protein
MKQVQMKFPDDETGDVFRRMQESEFNFSEEHIVNFHAVFSTAEEADKIALMFVSDTSRYENIETQPYDEGGMELTISQKMLLTYESVSSLENLLASRVGLVEGYMDGWGVMQA